MLTSPLTHILIYLWIHSTILGICDFGFNAVAMGVNKRLEILGAEINNHELPSGNVFHDPKFWQHFEKMVRDKAWSCDFDKDILQVSLQKDATLYDDPTTFMKRRSGVQQWVMNSTSWVTTVLGATKELSDGKSGKFVQQLEELKVLEAFSDYLDHLNFFHMVSDKMASLGQKVIPLSQDSSRIHDIDKLDPVMLVGYSEKFEDFVNTSIWDLCVDRHTKVNPHHQAHCMWHGCCEDTNGCAFCEDLKIKALREMVCDKVSRRVQKTLGRKLSKEMWDVEMFFYSGLPDDWLERAKSMMLELKGNDTDT